MKVIHPALYSPTVSFNTSSKCNYRCRMCFWSDPEIASKLEAQEDMSMALFENALDQAVPYVNKLSLTVGGEFMAEPHWKERLSMIANKCRENPNLIFHQTSNASLLTPKNLKYMEGIHNAVFTLSVDALDPLNYAGIRKPGKLGSVLFNIRNLRRNLAEIGVTNVSLQFHMTLMKRNVFEIPDLLHLAKEIGARLAVEHMEGGFAPQTMQVESLFNYPAFSNKYLGKCKQVADALHVSFSAPPPFAITTEEIDRYFSARKDKKRSCLQLEGQGTQMQVQADGSVAVCCGGLVFGNLNKENFKDIFFSEKFRIYRDAIRSDAPPPPCNACRFLQQNMPYLYESAVYRWDIPPENRNLDQHPDFKNEGFYDWLDEIPEEGVRRHWMNHLDHENEWRFTHGLDGLIQMATEETARRNALLTLARQQSKVIIYPAGGKAIDLLKNTTELSNCNIVAFADKDPAKRAADLNGLPVISPDAIISLKPDAVLVAVSKLYEAEILSELAYLHEHGISVIAI